MKQWIRAVGRGRNGARDLTLAEATEAAKLIVAGNSTEAQTAAFLIAERIKKETPDELLAFATEFGHASRKIHLSSAKSSETIDFAGPYDGRKTFAATVPVSILLAERGLPVFLHGIDTLPPKYGSTLKAIFEKLKVPVEASAKQIAQSIEEVNIGFAWTEKFCPPLAAIRPVREQIGLRTIINTTEKLLNLTNANSVMIGVFHKSAVDKLIPIFQKLSYKYSYIVQGADGSEDLPIHRKSFIYKVSQSTVDQMTINPEDFGLKHEKSEEKESLTLDQQVSIITKIVEGDSSEELAYYRDQVIFNAGIRYYLFGKSASIEEGIAYAKQQLSGKKAFLHLQTWRRILQQV
ncbi:anthranilate phosphoribosyltransferase [Anaerobacillus sp. MEB173]|uniref:anthranilate phosphoribosyltransferase n=1 Tax=Anaerobacillus sp. MEB173 TaxID=3383345 RepID=UPI003F8E0BC9